MGVPDGWPDAGRLKAQTHRRLHTIRGIGLLVIAFALTYLALPLLRTERATNTTRVHSKKLTPADEWEDNVWPFRQPTPWDISTDFEHPVRLQHTVREGTWLRLDVHPNSGEIVFDMLGDIYCIEPEGGKAHAVLRGVPHDVDPHFSPNGDRIAFRSDAGLGVDNIWVMPWNGCVNQALKDDMPGDPALLDRDARLMREGRANAFRVTNETFRTLSDPRWRPDGRALIATKWYTGERSIGAGEAWEYSVPRSEETISRGAGRRVVGRSLPLGWSAEDYGEQQVGGEQYIWASADGSGLLYSKNVIDIDGTFQYSKDVHKGIYAIFSHNITTGETSTLVSQFPGGASRPELSRDGRTLAFVRRVRDKEALVLKDLTSGTLTHIWYGLNYDVSTIFAPMGTYPSFAFAPNDDSVIIWAQGKIWRVPLKVNHIGEKVSGGSPTPIEFEARIDMHIARTLRPETPLLKLETAPTQRLHAFKELALDDTGEAVAFNAAGVTYVQNTHSTNALPQQVPTLHSSSAYYAPSFVPHQSHLVLHARWSDTNFSSLEIADLSTGKAHALTGLPMGRYISPTLCASKGKHRRLAVIRMGGDSATGSVVATAGAGLYVGDVHLPGGNIENLRRVDTQMLSPGAAKLSFIEGSRRLRVHQDARVFEVDMTAAAAVQNTMMVSSPMATEAVLTPDGETLAFVERMQVYVVSVEEAERSGAAWAKPGKAPRGLARVSGDGGHSISITRDGKTLFWLLGPYLHSLARARLSECKDEIASDTQTFGIGCVRKLLRVQRLDVTFESDTARIAREATAIFDAQHPDASLQQRNAAATLVVLNATLVTMQAGDFDDDLITEGGFVVRDGVINQVGKARDIQVPDGATVINAEGGVVVPGFMDIHAHWQGSTWLYPAKNWEQEAFLAYGVTLLHNPSFDNTEGFVERALVESGRMVGPRIYHTGNVIYGGAIPPYHQEIVDMEEAHNALTRIKVEGGAASFSYKNYQLPTRSGRQRLLTEARKMSMICVPEGGMNYDWDLTYIVDGMTTVEHNLPIAVWYDDLLTLFAKSGTGASPTHIVNYGGVMGEQFIWANSDLPMDPKARQFVSHDLLEMVTESTARPVHSYAAFNVSKSMAEYIRRGGLANVGAHGEPPIGVNYHSELFFFASGGLTPYEVLRSATRHGALSIGVFDSVGSLSVGKLADFVVYPPGVDILHDIRVSPQIRFVARSGRVWDATTLTEVWPVKGRKHALPPINAE